MRRGLKAKATKAKLVKRVSYFSAYFRAYRLIIYHRMANRAFYVREQNNQALSGVSVALMIYLIE